jgi:hypothetical protein
VLALPILFLLQDDSGQFMTAKQRREAAQASLKVKRKQGARVEEVQEEVVVRKSLLDEKVEMLKAGVVETKSIVELEVEESKALLEDLSNKKSLMSVQVTLNSEL